MLTIPYLRLQDVGFKQDEHLNNWYAGFMTYKCCIKL